MLIAQISDLHVTDGGYDVSGIVPTNAMVERAVAALLQLDPAPDMVIVSGDLTEHGEPAEYAALRGLLEPLPMPVYAIPGNHDRRDAMRAAFDRMNYLPAAGPLNFVVESRPLRVIGLDSSVERKSHGALVTDTLDFLRAALAGASNIPTLIMVHHPPAACGIEHMDEIRLLEGADDFARILSENPQVQRVVSGHVHRPVLLGFAGIPCQIAPSVAHQVALDLSAGGAACFNLEPPAFLLHRWNDKAGLVTHMAYVDGAPGPYRFRP